jgi:hypothetical protein
MSAETNRIMEVFYKIATRRTTRVPDPERPIDVALGKSAWLIEPDQTSGLVTIRNVELKQYLTTIGNRTRDPQRRNVFTSTERSAAALWAIEPAAYGERILVCKIGRPKGKLVRIKNQLHGEYLYAAGKDLAIDEDNRNIFTWIDEQREPAAYLNPYYACYGIIYESLWYVETTTKC